ncbi:MAG: DUF2752 domain-containing protein [Lachnospiraceae bacterium]|nr:DUF2752 domain-containing protein [Lachnospiraceae bacterium]
MIKKDKSLEDELYIIGWIALLMAVVGAWIFLRFILPNMPERPCIIYEFFGVYCPGCGGTRAVIQLLHGRLLQSLWYHPLVMYGVVLYVCFMISHTLSRLHILKRGMRFREGYLYGALVVLALNFILKNILKFGFGIIMI